MGDVHISSWHPCMPSEALQSYQQVVEHEPWSVRVLVNAKGFLLINHSAQPSTLALRRIPTVSQSVLSPRSSFLRNAFHAHWQILNINLLNYTVLAPVTFLCYLDSTRFICSLYKISQLIIRNQPKSCTKVSHHAYVP